MNETLHVYIFLLQTNSKLWHLLQNICILTFIDDITSD